MNAPTPFAPQANFDIGALYAGQYLKADDLGGKTYAATIAAVERVEIPEQDGSVRPKAAVTLQGWPAKLLLNKTNFETIAAAYGRQIRWLDRQADRGVPGHHAVRWPHGAVHPGAGAAAGSTASGRSRRAAPAAPMAPTAASHTAAAAAAVAGSDAPAQAPLLPPLMTAADFADDIPY